MNPDLKQKYPWLFLDKPISVDIIYDLDEDAEETNEREQSAGADTAETADALFDALKSTGHRVQLIPLTHTDYQEIIPKLTADIIFNQVEEDELGFKVLKLLEDLNKPVTGVDSLGFNLSWDKTKIKELLNADSIPTPNYVTIKPNDRLDSKDLSFPLFVKAADDHGSLSINENSVVNNQEELSNQIDWIRKNIGGPALVEEYIDGRELQVTVLGNNSNLIALPIKEIVFGAQFKDRPKVVTYKAKWEAKSTDYQGTTKMECPAKLTLEEQKAIENAVKKASEVLKVRDYARFDIRFKNNIPYIIDYNANPAVGPQDASALPAKVFGLSYQEFITAIVAVALRRSQ